MLRITVESEEATVMLRLDGGLAGPEANELTRTWSRGTFAQPDQQLLFDLTGVTVIDVVGMSFLAQMHRQGATLVGGAATEAIVDEIVGRSESSAIGGSGVVRDGLSGGEFAFLRR